MFVKPPRSKLPQPALGRARHGGALVELVVCLPILVFLICATIEVCDLIFLRNSLTAAAYSGTLEVSRLGSTEASVRDKIQETLTATNVLSPTITVAGPGGTDFNSSVQGNNAEITVSALVAPNLRISGFLQGKAAITVNARAVK